MKKTRIAKLHSENLVLYEIDGTAMRNELDIDFVGAGHHLAHPIIPKNEIWIEKTLTKADKKAYLLHELIEHYVMSLKKFLYPKAHELANKAEQEFRNGCPPLLALMSVLTDANIPMNLDRLSAYHELIVQY